jgi:2,3-bisphosphoglycerate-independent phosphoglycerate mutase
VATYDLKPAMSADGVCDLFCDGIATGRYGFGLVNFANADMVGHSGVIPAVVEAVETVDRCLGRVTAAVERAGGVCLVTADHGNAEQMLEPDGSPHTAHTTNPVPLIAVGYAGSLREGGRLADVAPTILELLGLAQPAEMDGRGLLAGVL